MDLTPFIKKTVTPGEPLTAQAWNDIVEGVDGAYKFLQASMHIVRVTITNLGLDPESVRVTASRTTGAPVEAVRPIGPGTTHVLSRLEPGAWTITAEAPGFATATQAITITGDAPDPAVSMALTPVGKFMPDFFGAALSGALQQLRGAGITNGIRLFDFNGRELPPTNPGSDSLDAPVLVQYPAVGTSLAPTAPLWLVIAVPVPVEPAVEVPSLAGLTQQEAQKALEAIGLALGKVNMLQKQP